MKLTNSYTQGYEAGLEDMNTDSWTPNPYEVGSEDWINWNMIRMKNAKELALGFASQVRRTHGTHLHDQAVKTLQNFLASLEEVGEIYLGYDTAYQPE